MSCSDPFSGSWSGFLVCCVEWQAVYILSWAGEHLTVVVNYRQGLNKDCFPAADIPFPLTVVDMG